MNLQTLTSGSIVMWEGELVTYIGYDTNLRAHEFKRYGKKKSVWLDNKGLKTLQPVPITPELLEALKWKYNTFKIFELDDNISISFYKYEIYIDVSGYIDGQLEVSKWNLHDFQHFLRGIDGLDFEITLDKLKDYKHGK